MEIDITVINASTGKTDYYLSKIQRRKAITSPQREYIMYTLWEGGKLPIFEANEVGDKNKQLARLKQKGMVNILPTF